MLVCEAGVQPAHGPVRGAPASDSLHTHASHAAGDDSLRVTTTFCSTYTQVQDGSSAPAGSVAVATPKAEVFSWAIANLEEVIYDTHRSVGVD